MEDSRQIIIPAKFIGLILHLIAATMLFFGYRDNIISAYPDLTAFSDTRYVGGKTSFMAANVLTVIGLSAEIIILFVGVNLFKERLSVFNSTLHILGAILYISYGFGLWQFSTLWALWAVFSFTPLVIEIFGACYPSGKWFLYSLINIHKGRLKNKKLLIIFALLELSLPFRIYPVCV